MSNLRYIKTNLDISSENNQISEQYNYKTEANLVLKAQRYINSSINPLIQAAIKAGQFYIIISIPIDIKLYVIELLNKNYFYGVKSTSSGDKIYWEDIYYYEKSTYYNINQTRYERVIEKEYDYSNDSSVQDIDKIIIYSYKEIPIGYSGDFYLKKYLGKRGEILAI